MANATIPLTSFTGGEWSPRLHGRVDVQKYNTACEVLQNMVIYPHGGITRRMGMEYIENSKVESVRLIPFEYNREQAYVLEFGSGYIRFYRNGAQIAPLGVPLEISTPYFTLPVGSGGQASINDIAFAQSNDILYLVHPRRPPQKLERTGPDSFTLTAISFTSTPAEWTGGSDPNYPSAITLFQNRLVLGGTAKQPQTLWMSKVSSFEDMTIGTAANDALKLTLSSTQNNSIRWFASGPKLLIGTNGGEFSLDLPYNNASNVQVKRESNFGSKSGRVQVIGNDVFYISRDGRKIRGMGYSFNVDGYDSPDLSLFSEHLFRGGLNKALQGIREIDFAQNPDGVLWTVLENGGLCGFTYLKAHEVQAWHRHETNGSIKSVCTIEGTNGSEVWFAVYRNGATRIERMAESFEGESPNDTDCAYFDSYLTYDSVPADNFSGLDHLEGMTVSVLGDGLHLKDQVVTGGAITLERECSKVVIGLKYEWKVIPLRLEGGSVMGFSQGKRKRVESLVVRFERSAGVKHKIKDGAFQSTLPTRKFGSPMGTEIELFSGDKVIPMHGKWDLNAQFELSGDGPFPVTILMIGANVVVNE